MTINIPCWTTSKEEADKLVDELSEGCYEYGKDESKEKMLDVFYKTKMLKNYVGIMQGRIELLTARIAELEVIVKGHDPFEDFPSKERGFECSVVVLGKFEYEDEFNPITNWDLCVYWFDEERWHPLNGYVAGDDIVKWYSLPEEREE